MSLHSTVAKTLLPTTDAEDGDDDSQKMTFPWGLNDTSFVYNSKATRARLVFVCGLAIGTLILCIVNAMSFWRLGSKQPSPSWLLPAENSILEILNVTKPTITAVEIAKRDRNGALTSLDSNLTGEESSSSSFDGINVFIIGFAKCATTATKNMFVRSEDFYFLGSEGRLKKGDINKILFDSPTPNHAVQSLQARLDVAVKQASRTLSKEQGRRTAIKTPRGIRDMTAIELLANHTSSDTKLILGLRHPVRWFESLYNYRTKKFCLGKTKQRKQFPPAETLLGSVQWRGVSTENARFDLFMKQLAKTDLNSTELSEMEVMNLRPAPNPYKLFLYQVEQISDQQQNRSAQFREDFRDFVGFQGALWPLQHKKRPQHKEIVHCDAKMIDICDNTYDELRHVLVSQGSVAADWIHSKFLASDDVVAGGELYFSELLSLWGTDPCVK